MIRLSQVFATVLVLLGASASAADVTSGSLKISAAWARATPRGATIGGGYMTITNAGSAPDRLIGGSAAVSDKVEVHAMSMDNGVMKMRAVTGGLEIKPGQTVTLRPGGLHVMFVGLKSPLAPGQTLKVALEFEKAGKVEVDYPVVAIGASGAGNSGAAKSDMPSMGGMKH